jgi:hypothetical protein
MIDGLVAAARGADLLVFESYTFAGPLAAAIAGIPAVHHLLGPALPLEAMGLGGDAVSPLWRTWKLDPRPFGGTYAVPTLNICPPVLGTGTIPEGTTLIPLRPVPLDATGSEQLPGWLDELAPDPTVYVILATVTNRDTSIFGAVRAPDSPMSRSTSSSRSATATTRRCWASCRRMHGPSATSRSPSCCPPALR